MPGYGGSYSDVLLSEANFHFQGPSFFQIGGHSERFVTIDVIQISTTRAPYIY